MTLYQSFCRLFISLLVVVLAQNAWSAAEDLGPLIAAAKDELSAGNAEAAFSALQAEESEHAGNIEFDYWLGLAANRVGKSGRAMFALERVLAQQPRHAAARLELALAYARLNLGEAARRELDILDGQNPPPAAVEQIAALRQQLGLGDQARRLGKRIAFITLEGGYDDNVGSYPKDFGFPGINPDPIKSPFGQLSAGVRQRVDLRSNQHLMLSLNGMLKRNTDSGDDPLGNDDATQFDQNFVGGRAEWAHDINGRREVALAGDAGSLQLDGDHYYSYFGADAEWREQVSAAIRVLLTAGLRDMQFENDQYDHVLSRVRGGVRYRLNQSWSLSADLAMEYERDKNFRPGGSARRVILSGSAVWLFRPNQRITTDFNYAYTNYFEDYGVPYNDSRDDNRIVVGLQWDKTIQRLWQVKARLQHRYQDSTLSTYTFDQTSGNVSLTRYF